MTMYHVLDDRDQTVFSNEFLNSAVRAADHSKKIKLNGSANFHVEKRERIYTTSTLGEAIKGTPYDPAFIAPDTDVG